MNIYLFTFVCLFVCLVQFNNFNFQNKFLFLKNFSWFFGSKTIQASERAWVVGGSLVIVGVRAEDAGEYHCVANNTAGSSRYTTHLAVGVPISVQVRLKNSKFRFNNFKGSIFKDLRFKI